MSARLHLLALLDVCGRYRQAFALSWSERQTGAKRYTAHEAEFLPAALALIEKPVSPTARITALLLVLLVLAAVVWAALAHVDIVVTATGKVIPAARIKTIASVDTASVRAIHVTEGQLVRAGDLLLELDAGIFEADERKAAADVDAARLERARARALIDALDTGKPPILARVSGITQEAYEEARAQVIGRHVDYVARRRQLEGEIARYSRALPLARERARNYAGLSEMHDVSMSAWSEREQAAIDLEGQLSQARHALESLFAETRREALDSLTKATTLLASATAEAARAHSHAGLLKLWSPVDGAVQQLTAHTIGGVVAAAQPLMVIVPKEGTTQVEGYIDNKDIGFVRPGQLAQVKIAAFDYTKHGMVQGKVELVSQDAIEDEKRGLIYKVSVRLDHPWIRVNGRAMRLEPGMAVSVEIKTGTRRVLEYLMSPLLRHGHESLNER